MATGVGRGVAGGATVAGAAAACGPRRILSSEAWNSAMTTPQRGHRSLATSPAPHFGHVSAITPSPQGAA
jgi:hypothetical protein